MSAPSTLVVDSNNEVSNTTFSVVGVRAGYLSRFMDEHGGRASFEGLTTTQVCEQIVKPATLSMKASYCELLQSQGRDNEIGPATWFVSHAWKYRFLEVCDAIEAFFASENTALDNVIVWFDLFSNSQHDTMSKPFEWWTGTFMNAIESMGNVLMIVTPWNDPVTLTRAWCIFEVYACVKTGSRFAVGMTREENTRLLAEIEADFGVCYYNMLGTIKSEKAEAFKPEDRDAIFTAIRSEVGFTKMDSMVLRVMEEWMFGELRRVVAHTREVDEAKAAKWLCLLGRLLQKGGRLDEALTNCKEAYETSMRLLGKEQEQTLSAMSELGNAYQRQGRYDEALPLYVDCHKISKRVLGVDHLHTIASMNDLAGLYVSQDRYDKALPLNVECLETRKRVLGADHVHTIASMSNLAVLYESQGRYDEALTLFMECLETSRRVLGADHPNTMATMSGLAGLFESQGRYDEALPLYVDCLETRKRVLGADHIHTIASMNDLAVLYECQGNYDVALTLYLDCIEISRRVLGADHPNTLTYINNLEGLYENQDGYDEA